LLQATFIPKWIVMKLTIKKSGLVVLLLLFATYTFGSSVVVIVTSQGILLATDSQHLTGSENKEDAVKIYKTREFYYAADGFVQYKNIYNLATIVADALKSNIDFDKAKTEILSRWTSALDSAYLLLQKESPSRFTSDKKIRSSSVFIISRDGVSPFLWGMKSLINPDSLNTTKVHFIIQNASCSDISKDSAFVYESGKGRIYHSDFNMSNVLKNPRMAAVYLIENSNAKDSAVSGPIDILWIDSKGDKWIKRKKGTPLIL
jgi:hypothetical protein